MCRCEYLEGHPNCSLWSAQHGRGLIPIKERELQFRRLIAKMRRLKFHFVGLRLYAAGRLIWHVVMWTATRSPWTSASCGSKGTAIS